MSCTYTNDNNVIIKLLPHNSSIDIARRNNHEVIFRKINTYLINNKIIKNNIIDLGAWVGDNSIPWAMNIEGIVYAIDPSQYNINYINDMSKLNNITNITAIQLAISDKNEILTTNENINHCSFVYNNPGLNGLNKVSAVSLDYLYDINMITNIGYIHLDVEGMEYKVIKGSQKIISTFKPLITFEQHLEIDDYNEICKYLMEYGYHIFLIDEVLKGCREDCRNFIAFPSSIFTIELVNDINNHLNYDYLKNIV
jgi:FkbM family methyltransferase